MGFWTIFQTRPLAGAFAGVPGILVLPPLYARKCSHGPHDAQAKTGLLDAPGGPGWPWDTGT